ncbi:hypothetical protein G6F31_018012 [Rhizopus arrhizus]|nr:hypothetical protein G6F31_018012 [Rhizopus arrhizus]
MEHHIPAHRLYPHGFIRQDRVRQARLNQFYQLRDRVGFGDDAEGRVLLLLIVVQQPAQAVRIAGQHQRLFGKRLQPHRGQGVEFDGARLRPGPGRRRRHHYQFLVDQMLKAQVDRSVVAECQAQVGMPRADEARDVAGAGLDDLEIHAGPVRKAEAQ